MSPQSKAGLFEKCHNYSKFNNLNGETKVQCTISYVLITKQILNLIVAKSFSELFKIKHPIAGSRTEKFPDRKGRRIFTSSESIE